MPTAQQDTEITLGTGRMLAIFFAFVLVCAVFFAIGFSLGRRTSAAGMVGSPSASIVAPSTIVRPSAAKNGTAQQTPQSSSSSDFSFYKAVGEKGADTGLAPARIRRRRRRRRPQRLRLRTHPRTPQMPARPRLPRAGTTCRLRGREPAGRRRVTGRRSEEEAVSGFHGEQSFHRQVLPCSGRTLCRTERRGGDARSAHQRWV